MEDMLKKGLLTAIGTASIAAENADKILRNVAKKGLISTKDARNLVKKLANEAEREGKRVQKIISAELKKQVKKTKPIVREGKKAISEAAKTIKKAQKSAEKRGKNLVRKAAKRLR